MILARREQTRRADENIFAIWECRYFTPKLPYGFQKDEIVKILGPEQGSSLDDDIYFLAGGDTFNIKLRKRANTIKVKALLERKDDDFELWEPKIESRLPAREEVWRFILPLLDSGGELPRLSRCLNADQVLDALRLNDQKLKWMEIRKQRTFYSMSKARVEIAKIIINGKNLYSMAIESYDLEQARMARGKLPTKRLGIATNYVDMLMKLSQSSAAFDT